MILNSLQEDQPFPRREESTRLETKEILMQAWTTWMKLRKMKGRRLRNTQMKDRESSSTSDPKPTLDATMRRSKKDLKLSNPPLRES
jgi:hypothetical protein